MLDIPLESPLQKAVRLAGGQLPLARKATQFSTNGKKLTQAMVWKWLNQAKELVPPPAWVIPIERAVNGEVTRHELRLDIYPVAGGTPGQQPEQAAA